MPEKNYILEVDRVLCGDARATLKTLPSSSIDCCITSPPYYGLRDYGVAGQIGLEESPEAYVARLVDVFRGVRRVLKDSGTLWLNLGDSYCRDPAKGGSGPNGKHDFIPDYGNARKIMRESKGSFDGGVGCAERAPVRVGGPNRKHKDLVGIPWMVAFALRADGWYLRSDIIWEKGNPMPESVKDRCCKSHEYIFILSKRPKYYFDSIAIQEDAVGNGNKNMLQVQAGASTGQIQQEQSAIGWPNGCMQNMPIRNEETLESQIQPNREGEGNSTPLLLFRKGANGKEGISRSIRANGRAEREISNCDEGTRKDREIQGSPEAIRPISKGQSDESPKGRKVRQDGERQICEAKNRDKTQSSNQIVGLHVYQGRVGRDQRQIRPSVCILPSADATAGNGSCEATVEGWDTHGGEHSPGVQIVQFQQGQSRCTPKRTKRSVWHVNTKPFKEAHFATFPEKLVEPCILAGCPPGGVVLDPFFGAGTVGVVAKRHGRRYIGVELNPEYVAMAHKRLAQIPVSLLAF